MMMYCEQNKMNLVLAYTSHVLLLDKAALRKENARLRASISCCQCGARVQTLFLPCRDLITCEECAEKMDDCLKCGKRILGTVRVYLIWSIWHHVCFYFV